MKRYTLLLFCLFLFSLRPLHAFEPISVALIGGASFVIGYTAKALLGTSEKPIEVVAGSSHLVRSERERHRCTLPINHPSYFEELLNVEAKPEQAVQDSLNRLSTQQKKLKKIEEQEPKLASKVQQELKAVQELYEELAQVRSFLGDHKKKIKLFLLRKKLYQEYPAQLRSLYVSSSHVLRLAHADSSTSYPLTSYHKKLNRLIEDTSNAYRLAGECRDYSLASEMNEASSKLKLLQNTLVNTDQYQQEVVEKRYDSIRENREQMQAIRALELKLHSEQTRASRLRYENSRLHSDLQISHDCLQRTQQRCNCLSDQLVQLQEDKKRQSLKNQRLEEQLKQLGQNRKPTINTAPEGQPPYEATEHVDAYVYREPSAPPEDSGPPEDAV